MKFTTAISALALFSASAIAQKVQSAPFNLTVTTVDGKYNNTPLAACHEGAGIESLCAFGSGSTFHFNTTKGTTSSVKGDSPSGVLTWLLPSTPIQESEGLGFTINPASNVAHPQFGFGTNTLVAFDSQNRMNVVSFLDDTVSPPNDDAPKAYYRWVMCQENFEGYAYNKTLNFVLGLHSPQNPSCVKATVKRVFV